MDKQEIIGTVGLLLIVAGVGWIYPPAALILGGALLFVWAFITARPKAQRAQGEGS